MIVLDLCAGSGAWSQPYADAGATVFRFDKGEDVRLLELDRLPKRVDGVLAAPPCTVFSLAGQWVDRTPAEMIEALSVVDACLRIARLVRPRWWALENPCGTLSKWIGAPSFRFRYSDFGDPIGKPTHLWGDFEVPILGPVVRPSRTIQSLPSTDPRRHITGAGFARAFFEVNP